MTREAEEREKRLKADLEQLRCQEEQPLGTLDTRLDAMIESRTQAKMDRFDCLLGITNEFRKTGAHSREASSEPRVVFKEHSR